MNAGLAGKNVIMKSTIANVDISNTCLQADSQNQIVHTDCHQNY